MNVLFVGLGSIGQRHLRNIRKIYPKYKIFAYRRVFKTPTLNNSNRVLNQPLKKKYKITYVNSLKKLSKYSIDIGIICSPSNMHVDESISLLKQNINIFVEKPLGSSLKNINKLNNLALKSKKVSMVGFQLKFCPIINFLKNTIKSKKFGIIKYLSIHHGEHIKNFHTYEKYEDLYAARKKLGGGVILTQIHEIDYLLYLLSDYSLEKTKSIDLKISDLKIDVEDISSNILVFKNYKNERVITNINLNYFEIPRRREINIIFQKARIKADLIKQEIIILTQKNKKILKFPYKRNDLFMKELKYFIKCVKYKKKVKKDYDIKNAISSLKIALKLKN